MRRSIPILAAAFLWIWTVAQAAEDKPADKAPDKAAEIAAAASKPTEAKGGDCVFSRTINNWEAIDDETLIVWAPTRHHPYLVKLWTPAFGLRSEFSVGVQDANNDGQLCDYGRDAIVVRSPGGPERYKVRIVQRLDEAQANALIDARKHKKGETGESATMPEQSDVKSDKRD